MTIKIATDSTITVDPELIEKYNIDVIILSNSNGKSLYPILSQYFDGEILFATSIENKRYVLSASAEALPCVACAQSMI